MIKIVFRGSTPFVGTDYAHVEEFPAMPSERELDEMAWQYSVENASSYGDVCSYGDVYDDENDECYGSDDPRHFLESDIDGWWEIYNSEKHDDILS